MDADNDKDGCCEKSTLENKRHLLVIPHTGKKPVPHAEMPPKGSLITDPRFDWHVPAIMQPLLERYRANRRKRVAAIAEREAQRQQKKDIV